MATLAGSTIASTYTYLLKMDATSGITSSLVAVQDGDATDSALKISTTSASVVHTVTTSASSPVALLVDANTSGVAAQDSVGMHVDFDRTVAGSGTAAHNDIGINLDVNSASLGTSSVIGMDIDVVGAASGTSTATGLTVTVGSADTNYAAIFTGGNVGIGTISPDYNFEIEASGTFSKMVQTVYRDSDKGNYQDMFYSRGTVGSPAVVQDDDELFTLRAFGYNADGTAFDQAGAIIFSVDGTPSSSSDSSDMPGRIEFWTTPDDSETPIERMRITSAGISEFSAVDGGTENTTLSTNASGHTLFGNDTANGDMNYNVSGTGGHYFSSAVANMVTFSSLGNVGIIDTDPSEARLSIGSVLASDYGIKIVNAQATSSIFIDQNSTGGGSAIEIDTEAATGVAIFIDTPATESVPVLKIADCDSLTSGNVAYFHSDSVSTTARNLVEIINDDYRATSATCLNLRQDSAGAAIKATSVLGYLNTGAGAGLVEITHTGNSSSNTNNLLFIKNDDASSSGTTCLFIDQDANQKGIDINNVCTTSFGILVQADALTTGKIGYFYSNAPSTSSRNLVHIVNDNVLADDAITLNIGQDGNGAAFYVNATDASYTSQMVFLNAVGRSSDAGFDFLKCLTDGDDDVQAIIRGDGVVAGDASYSVGADYAEYFESKDGSKIEVGTTVKLDGDKVVVCESGDTPIGVIRPLKGSASVGNTAWSKWQGKYQVDDYGSPVMEEYSVTEWMEDTDEVKHEAVEAKDAVLYEEGDELPEGKEVGDEKEAAVEAEAVVYMHNDIQYQTDKIPSDVTVPDDATVKSTEYDGSKLMRKKLNPDYDESIEYEPREERDEWHIVGLLGQIPITKGQPMSDSWIKMKDVSDTVEMYFVK
jgi:hypothetical protein